MTNITLNLKNVHRQMADFAEKYGRDVDNIRLLAVSKRHPASLMRQACEAGQRDFAENHLQEALEKIVALADLDICWHFIGPVQSNKTRGIAEHFDWVHSVDRLKIAQRLDAQRPGNARPLNVCLQVHIGDETGKSGASIPAIDELAQAVAGLPRLNLRGLMCIPPPEPTLDRQRAHFAELRTAFETMQATWPSCDTLSMGMTGDMEAAIAEGSSLLRIGTAIFGLRPV